ncbi:MULTISPECIES: alanine racemase [Psychrilyobacter]|uniref:Alanine racemase n=1 Tax=Psychrilyobacter piezotolerans TaxID=2293438 RepID=A0ABX9KKU0_9FUSO|nr:MULTISPECIES: alanine racemase [Psychrilyobacter]MCS5420385.1 alanine racemase [Psychrilyobacter sp. S5]NDI76395.1 alanine racemase [Psychrilyobacter piezotolerans]RDE65991.1 alanine racemase [Psychrilyobacter sp. S5]REI43169.1 alanine racemase [Psychrilyobacter piezotolerans]
MELDVKRPVWVEINLDNLGHNMREIKKHIKPGTEVMAVIKADAYGHGALGMIETLKSENINKFAVAVLSEAIEIRNSDKDIQIILLGYTPDANLEEVIKWNITPTIYSLRQAEILDKLAGSHGKKIAVHISVDTGMHRVGLPIKYRTVEVIKEISEMDNLCLEGVYTHFAVADEADKGYTIKQVEEFKYIIDELEKLGVEIPIKHVSNSAAILDLPEFNYDMVRAGLLMYGLYPSEVQEKDKVIELKSVMSLHSKIYHIRTLEKGKSISYGLTYTVNKDSRLGLIPIGYADGYSRGLSNKASVIIKGKNRLAKVAGAICMDKFVVDITDIDMDINGGDEVILFGEDEYNKITPEDLADMLGTISYEILCNVSKRVPRVYKKGNKIMEIKDEVLDKIDLNF